MSLKDLKALGWLWFAASACILLLLPALPALAAAAPSCTFREVTGIPCFTCGSTRALLALRSGSVLQALNANPLMAVGAAAFTAGGFLGPWLLPKTHGLRLPRRWTLWVFLVFAVNWVYLVFRTVRHNDLTF